jgi:hypothetical protein
MTKDVRFRLRACRQIQPPPPVLSTARYGRWTTPGVP